MAMRGSVKEKPGLVSFGIILPIDIKCYPPPLFTAMTSQELPGKKIGKK